MKRLRLARLQVVLFGLTMLVVSFSNVTAAVLLDRSINLLDPKPGANTSHTFAFNIQSNSSVGSIAFEYCNNSPLFTVPCSIPAGLDVSAATLNSQTGETGFSIDAATTTNRLVIGRPAVVTNIGQAQYSFSSVINPSTLNESVYVRISLHGSSDGTGVRTDEGAVVFDLAGSIDTRAYVPPHLTFCTGISVALDCGSTDGFYINMGELNRSSSNTGTSQYSGATNDLTGYFVSLFGVTMTAGNNTIPALSSPSSSIPGTSQFGVNLRDNANPDAGEEPIGAGTAAISPSYAISNNFKFVSGDTLSSASLPSNFNRFTITYLVNASPAQAPGIYNATFTFIATASF